MLRIFTMKIIISIAVAILCLGCFTSCSVTKQAANKDGIPFVTDTPTESFLSDWAQQNSLKCKKLIQGKTEGYTVPSEMIENEPCLVYLILNAKTMAADKSQQEWFDLYSMMNESQISKLYSILYRENAKLIGNEMNQKAYDFAKQKKYKKAIKTINKAIATYPNEANYYDSKGEFLLNTGNTAGALEMWKKVIEVDPDFLSKHNTTVLYENLKNLGLIK